MVACVMQHRVTTGCYSARLGSSNWRPGSSGRARCKVKMADYGCTAVSASSKGFFLFLKLFVICSPLMYFSISPITDSSPFTPVVARLPYFYKEDVHHDSSSVSLLVKLKLSGKPSTNTPPVRIGNGLCPTQSCSSIGRTESVTAATS